MFPIDPRQQSALSDAVFMLRLYKRVAYGLVPRLEPGGARFFLHSFLSVDGRCVASADPPMEPRAVLSAVSPIFPAAVVAGQDVALLLHVLPLEAHHVETPDCVLDGGIRLSDVMSTLRLLTPFHTWQVSDIVDRVRAVVGQSAMMSPFEEHVADVMSYESDRRRQFSEPPPPPLTTRELDFFFDRVCGLSISQAHVFARYIAQSNDDKDSDDVAEAGVKLDVRCLHHLLFSEEIPAVAEYPLLMGRFAEATLDGQEPEAGPTGTRALLRGVRSMELTYPDAARSTPLDLDFGSLIRAVVTPRQFFYLCKTLLVGFQQRESDQLFYYLKKEHHSSDGVMVSDLVAAFRQYFPPVTMSMLHLVRAATVGWMRRGASDSLAFVKLYTALQQWGASRIPIEAFVKSFRDAGVPDGVAGVLDIELEWLRLKAPTRVDLLLMLCAPVAPSRTAVIQKLFQRLDTASDGRVSCTVYLQRFDPKRIEGDSVRRQVTPWKAALAAYVTELREESLDYELFAYFWYMVSAGVEDDPTFTVAIWQGFSLADDGGRPRLR